MFAYYRTPTFHHDFTAGSIGRLYLTLYHMLTHAQNHCLLTRQSGSRYTCKMVLADHLGRARDFLIVASQEFWNQQVGHNMDSPQKHLIELIKVQSQEMKARV